MSLWICPNCATLTGPECGACPKCGHATEYATITAGTSNVAMASGLAATGGYVAPPESTDAAVLRDLRVWLKFREDELTGAVVQANLTASESTVRGIFSVRAGIREVMSKLEALTKGAGQ